MSRFGNLIRGKAAPVPVVEIVEVPVVEIVEVPESVELIVEVPEPVVEEQSSKLSGFFSGRLKKSKKSKKTEE